MQSREDHRAPNEPGAALRREADYWTIVYEGTIVRLKDAKGLRYLEHLLRHPGQSFHVADLMLLASGDGKVGDNRREAGRDAVERARKSVTNRIQQTLARIRAANEPLGIHLSNAVHTGTHCRYRPERPIRWE
jgi:hypothetical protein